jgi:hypothetical protein
LVVAAQGASPAIRLVGGAGLSLLLGHRTSDDLDLFGDIHEELGPVVRAIEHAARTAGSESRRVQEGPGFVRLEVADPTGMLRVDVAADTAQRIVAEPTLVGPIRVESLRDQRANKLVTLLGRSELRDLVDLYFIEQAGLPALDGFADAVAKDGGMDPAWFAWAVSQIIVRPLRGMLLPLGEDELRAFQVRLRLGALDRVGPGTAT